MTTAPNTAERFVLVLNAIPFDRWVTAFDVMDEVRPHGILLHEVYLIIEGLLDNGLLVSQNSLSSHFHRVATGN